MLTAGTVCGEVFPEPEWKRTVISYHGSHERAWGCGGVRTVDLAVGISVEFGPGADFKALLFQL